MVPPAESDRHPRLPDPVESMPTVYKEAVFLLVASRLTCSGPAMLLRSISPPTPPPRSEILPVPSAAKLEAITIGVPIPLPLKPCKRNAYWPFSRYSLPVGVPPQAEVDTPVIVVESLAVALTEL